MAGCAQSQIDEVDVGPSIDNEDIVLSDDTKVTYCDHKYSHERDFYYKGQMTSYQNTMFGEEVFTHEFILLNDNKHYLNGRELENYNCERVNNK